MGIKGLVTFCKLNGCYEEYDLVALAKRNNSLELLVDYYGIEQHIMELTLKNLAMKNKNEYLVIPGGEYDEFANAFREFHQVFKNLGIKLVFVVDGPKGLDVENHFKKQKSWEVRLNKTLKQQETFLEYCKNPQSPFQYIRETLIRPFLLQDIFKSIIKREGGTIITLIYGEADYQIAKLQKERNSWAVLTNDSDFFAFKNCPTIQIGFFDLERDLMMGRNYRKDLTDGEYCCMNPKKLLVGMISGEILMSRLCLSSFEKLIEFSIFMGNDYSSDFAVELRDTCKIAWKYDKSDVADSVAVAKWVEQQTCSLLDNVEYNKFLKMRPDAEQYVKFTIDFYNCNLVNTTPIFSSERNEYLWSYLETRYRNVDIPSFALSVFHGFCYQRNCVEPHFKDNPNDINHILIPIRKRLYSLFLQQGKSVVIEYEIPNQPNHNREIHIEESVQKIDNIVSQTMQFSYHNINLRENSWKFFEESWSYWDFQDSPARYFRSLEFFRRYQTDIGFCCYCLRTLWLVTKRFSNNSQDLVITEKEFRAIFCVVFFRLLRKLRNFSRRWAFLYDELVENHLNSWFMQMRVCPSSTCLIVQEWLQTIFHLAYNNFGRSLRISHFFPEPQEFISGTVLSVFFEYVHNHGQRLRNVNSQTVNEVFELMNRIFEEFSYVYDTILQPY